MKTLYNYIYLAFIFIFLISCKNKSLECNATNIEIENRWYEYNGGIDNLKVKDKNDLIFICKRVNQFSKGEEVRVSHNHGYLTIFLNGQKIDMIFTVKNGVVYSVDVGRYVYDEELTNHIMKMMKINSRCWSKDCK
ncbi:SPRY domain-containing protein [Chryseobacterium gwangjuense]|uniref:hypothetical protein n=1 Tax=Chryseobacterium gwangjuense TaxID=1069980 RepID=UPI001E640BDD|nr:hypothetical protein [Chryseobacterium gwangjuense]MCE3074185.1 hypothetical protein [Chryseobacterium gwangjuense]